MIVPYSELSQRNVPRFSTIVGMMIGHTKACLIIDEQWDGRSRFDIIEFLFSLSVCLIERVLH